MAEPGRAVRVRGLPTDIEDDRLKDKLFIHFLRASNGGGEIDSVIIVKATPASALITFEDSKVAQRVIQRRRHILEVDGKKYTLTATEHRDTLNPDQVILSLAATVDYGQLPKGVMALASLRKSHPDVQINYTDTVGYCTVYGDYSKVQAALEQLLDQSVSSQSAENNFSGLPAPSGSRSDQTAQKYHNQEPEEQRRKMNIKKDKFNSSSNTDGPPGSYGWEDTSQTDGAALQLPPTSVEDYSLILDADMFLYLQKHCREEYQNILSHYGVEAVDMTNHGLTTLYLQVAAASRQGGREQERLKKANKAISRLYQENEAKVRRSQLPKSILTPRDGLKKAMDIISTRLPKLLLMEDEQNVYIIGSSSDVSEAKTFFLLDNYKERDKREDVASLLQRPSYNSEEDKIPITTSSPAGYLDDSVDQMLRSEEDGSRAEGARRYKLAARFKDSGLTPLGLRNDFTLRANPSPSKQTRPGPMLGHDVLSERAGISAQAAQNTGGDILFKTASPSSGSLEDKISLTPDLTESRPRSSISPFGTSKSGSSAPPPAGSGSTLKRASSFSGMPQQKAQVMSQKSQDESTAVRARGRSSSFSIQTESDKLEVSEAEITVPFVMWQYIKEAYGTKVEDLTSEVQMKESRSKEKRDLTLTLRGADSSSVSSCQLGLQKLVDSVSSNFSVLELPLSELGVTETDETLQACCSEVRSRFKKVNIHIVKKSIYLLGTQQLCSQVDATLREVFSGNLTKQLEQQHTANPSMWSSLQKNEDQGSSYGNSLMMLQSQTGKADGTSRSQEWRTTYSTDFGGKEVVNGSMSQPVKKDHVIKEKLKITDAVETDAQKTESHVNGVGSATNYTEQGGSAHSTPIESKEQEQAEIQNKPEDSKSDQGDQGCICICGESGRLRTKCGVTMCSKCLDTVHSHCRVCHETEQMPRGIQGKINKSKLHMSVPGHSKAGVIKITYCIPDGIQGEGHPSPGQPFHGGKFEAFLPDCEMARKLLPRLEKAFRCGLTFTVTGKEEEARVTWDCIPHKTSLQGGKSGNGYPDSSYLTRLSQILSSHGIEEQPARPQ
ncbi:uncharacterized protein LOC114440315 [Parambassis ranga]|uniref:RING-type E3 ubiquitin transferase n=1 Tax=Parambassis ranga TaxID=210632 RepID=A0A6P7IT01_9TELE|nr:uncharacterized protein LOC114440315 [Parambassis ranga]XP_028268494.1 uncharacterized protein LOC114440315 [Parambassis ranga]XP_028268495.1 uncharacterized protein LOC114440315 [Parambassis ranga]XP_028268496.1 uncharacterized protein LOC114440315 [Parambassis ranga]